MQCCFAEHESISRSSVTLARDSFVSASLIFLYKSLIMWGVEKLRKKANFTPFPLHPRRTKNKV